MRSFGPESYIAFAVAVFAVMFNHGLTPLSDFSPQFGHSEMVRNRHGILGIELVKDLFKAIAGRPIAFQPSNTAFDVGPYGGTLLPLPTLILVLLWAVEFRNSHVSPQPFCSA